MPDIRKWPMSITDFYWSEDDIDEVEPSETQKAKDELWKLAGRIETP